MQIEKIACPSAHWNLLLQADPYKPMVLQYLDKSTAFAAFEDEAVCGIVLFCPVEENTWEIKNLSVAENAQGKGIGKALVQKVKDTLPQGAELLVGTADTSTGNLIFYEKCGFSYDHTIPNFFVENYPEPIWEGTQQCIDMVVLRQKIGRGKEESE